MSSQQVDISIDPGRVLFGLSRIGNTTTSALCDIIDNSVRAEASNIYVVVHKKDKDYNDNRKNNVKDYLIIDDGKGMSEEGILNALKLGSLLQYEDHSLSKFGLELKSGAFSQGDELIIISSDGSGFNKYTVALPNIKEKYYATKEELSEEDNKFIIKYLPGGKGTIVRIGQVRLVNHPSVKKTIDELTVKLGVIYYFFIKENNLKIFIETDNSENLEPIKAFDVLFTDEANANGNLDENDWDGKTVRWIEKSKPLLLDKDSDVKAIVEVTQLPYPPMFNLNSGGTGDAEIRKKYMIGAGNYGYYVYRNKRLISWVQTFDGIIPQDQDFYSFRGRILIDDSADDCFNIDVKKSTLTLSDEAWNAVNDFSYNYKRKSKNAWQKAFSVLKAIVGEKPNQKSNEIVGDYTPPQKLPGIPAAPTNEVKQREAALQASMKKKLKEIIKVEKDLKNEDLTDDKLLMLRKGYLLFDISL